MLQARGLAVALLLFLLVSLLACGGGSSAAPPPPPPSGGALTITITGLPSGTSASVSVTGPNGYSTTLSATQTLTKLAAGTYTVVGNGATSGSSNYFPSVSSQTISVSNGATASVQVTYAVITPTTTKVLDQTGSQSLVVSSDGSTLTMSSSSSVAQSLQPGDILAVGITGATPTGALRKIVSIVHNGSQVVATTSQATLADAFQQADFALQTTLSPQNFQRTKALLPGVRFVRGKHSHKSAQVIAGQSSLADPCMDSSVTFLELISVPIVQDPSGSIAATGQIEVCPSFQFNWSIGGSPPTLKSLTSNVTFGGDIHVNVTGRFDKSFDKKVPILTATGEPIPVVVGNIPIIITPELTFFVGASGDVTAGFSAGVTQTTTVTAGIAYNNGQLSAILPSPQSNFGSDPFGLDAGLSAKAFAGLTIDLEVDGVLSPEFSPDAFLSLDVNLVGDPWWQLSGGLEGSGSVSVGIFGFNLADFDFPSLFEFSKTIAQANGGFSTSDAAPTLSTLTPSSSPLDGPPLTLTLTGSNFVPGAVTRFNGVALSTTFNDPTSLTATLPASQLATVGAFQVAVLNPDTSGAISSSLVFTVSSGGGGGVSFATPVSVSVPWQFAESAVATDFNADAKVDIAASEFLTQNIFLVFGDGTGNFNSSSSISLPATQIAAGDFNGDGHPDLVALTSPLDLADTIIVAFLNDGQGHFTRTKWGGSISFSCTQSVVGPQKVVVTDVNSDGKQDLIIGDDGFSVFLGNGDGTFTHAGDFGCATNPGSTTEGLAVGDFNNDGKPDVAVVDTSHGAITVWLGNGRADSRLRRLFQTALVVRLFLPTSIRTAKLIWPRRPQEAAWLCTMELAAGHSVPPWR